MNRSPYMPPSWLGLKRQIHHLSEFGGSVQVVCGAYGAGKSTLIADLITEFEVKPIVVKADPEQTPEAFYLDTLGQLGLRPAPESSLGELIMLLRKYAESQLRDQKRTVIVVDDAHYLSASELSSFVSVLQGNSEAGFGLHLLLFSEKGLAERIDALQLVDVTVHDAQIPPFSPSEVKAWLAKDFAQDVPGIDANLAQTLWSQSAGLPGAMLDKIGAIQVDIEDSSTSSVRAGGLPWGHIVALVVLVSVLIWAFLVRSPSNDPSELAKVDHSDMPNKENILQTKEPSKPAETKKREGLEVDDPPENTDDVVIPSDPSSGWNLETPSNAGKGQEASEKSPTSPAITASGPKVDNKSPSIKGEDQNSLGSAANSDKTRPVETQPKADAPETTSLKEAPKAADRDAQVSPSESKTDNRKVEQDLVQRQEADLLKLNAGGYVLQLMAASNKQGMMSYMDRQPNRENLKMYRMVKGNRLLYVLVEGFYADKASALAAKQNLPPEQSRGGPWPKQLLIVHREIRAARSNRN